MDIKCKSYSVDGGSVGTNCSSASLGSTSTSSEETRHHQNEYRSRDLCTGVANTTLAVIIVHSMSGVGDL